MRSRIDRQGDQRDRHVLEDQGEDGGPKNWTTPGCEGATLTTSAFVGEATTDGGIAGSIAAPSLRA